MRISYSNLFKRAREVVLGCCLIFPLSSYAGSDKQIYRYKNEKGEIVFNSHIPKRFASKGYEIINVFGDLIEEIPPALTEEEKARLASIDSTLNKQKKQKKRQSEADKQLLNKFSDPEDAERARDRQLETIDIYISISLGNIKRLEAEMIIENEKAANMERNGKDVSKESLERMSRIKYQIDKAELFNKGKEQEKNVIRQAFDKDIQRLRQLRPARSKAEK